MNPLANIFDAKRFALQQALTERAVVLAPVFLLALLCVVIGALEGNAWRRGRLYAGYYRLIFFSSIIWFMGVAVSVAGWLIVPHMLSVRSLTVVIALPALLLGWSLTAGRPLLR